MVGFSGILDTGWVGDLRIMKDKLIDGKKLWVDVRGKLVKMVKDADTKFDDYSILPKTRQILLHYGYELTEKDFFIDLTN